MKPKKFWINPLELKWSGTVSARIFKQQNTRENAQAITPILVVRDTTENRRLLAGQQKPALLLRELQKVADMLDYVVNAPRALLATIALNAIFIDSRVSRTTFIR